MRQWKEAGRADRDSEAELWKRFRAAQDKFFTARAEVFSAKDAALREHADAKEQLLTQAQALLPVTDIRAARSAPSSRQRAHFASEPAVATTTAPARLASCVHAVPIPLPPPCTSTAPPSRSAPSWNTVRNTVR